MPRQNPSGWIPPSLTVLGEQLDFEITARHEFRPSAIHCLRDIAEQAAFCPNVEFIEQLPAAPFNQLYHEWVYLQEIIVRRYGHVSAKGAQTLVPLYPNRHTFQ